MADFLPPAVQKFIADVEQYVDPLQKAQRETDKFSREVEQAGIAADKAMSRAADAARKAEVAQKAAAEAAKKLEKGQISVDEAARLAAEAVKKLTESQIAEREASIAAANAADKESDQLRQLARQAAMTAAVEAAAAAKATGSIKQHKKAIQEVTDVFPELKNSGDDAFKLIDKTSHRVWSDLKAEGINAFKGVEASSVGMGAAVVMAVGAIPEIAGAAAGAVTGGLGLALGGLGVYATKGSATAKAAIKVMKDDIVSDAKSLVAPFNKVWVTIASDATGAFHDLYPELHSLFADMADVTSDWVDDITGSLHELTPAFNSVSRASATLERSLGPQMPTIMRNLGLAIKTITDTVNRDPDTFTNLAVSLSKLLVWVAKAIDLFDKFGDVFSLTFAEFGKGMPLVEMFGGALGMLTGKTFDLDTSTKGSIKSFQSQADAIVNAQRPAEKAQTTFHGLATSEQVAKIATDQLKQAFDRLTGANQSAVESEINVQQAIDDTSIALRTNGKTLDLNTQKGRDNMTQLIADARAYQDRIVAMKNDGYTQQQVGAEMVKLRKLFIAQATAMTGNAKTARELADRLLGIAAASKKVPKTVRQDIYQVMHLTTTQAYLNKRKNILGYARGGSVRGYADGGKVTDGTVGGTVTGVGTETSDSIVVFLSKNEFVVNARQAKRHRALLEAINSGVAGFANGGSVGAVVNGGYTHLQKHVQKVVKDHYAKNAKHANFTGDRHAEYRASRAMAAQLKAFRSSPVAAWMSRGGLGSDPRNNVVAQHTNVNVYVAGSVRSDRDLEEIIQQVILQRNLRNPTSGVNLPAGRVGGI